MTSNVSYFALNHENRTLFPKNHEIEPFYLKNLSKSILFISKTIKIDPLYLKNHQNRSFLSQKPSKSILFISKTIKIDPFLGEGVPSPHQATKNTILIEIFFFQQFSKSCSGTSYPPFSQKLLVKKKKFASTLDEARFARQLIHTFPKYMKTK